MWLSNVEYELRGHLQSVSQGYITRRTSVSQADWQQIRIRDIEQHFRSSEEDLHVRASVGLTIEIP